MDAQKVYVKFGKQQFPLEPLTTAAVEHLRDIALQLTSGTCPLEEIFSSLGELLTPAVRDKLFPDYNEAVCDELVSLWMAACDGVLYLQRQRQKQYLRRLKSLKGGRA